MSYLSRACVAASAAAFRDRAAEQGAAKPLRLALLPAAAASIGAGRVLSAAGGSSETDRAATDRDDSVRKALFISCWAAC